jgi:hypothetical protein
MARKKARLKQATLSRAAVDAGAAVDHLCEPKRMPRKEDAVEFYGLVIEHCQSAVEALEEEIANEAGR